MANNNSNNNNGQNTTPSSRSNNVGNKSNQVSELDLINVNAKEVKKELNDVFSYVNDNLKNINRDTNKYIKNLSKEAVSANKTIFKDLFKSLDKYSDKLDDTLEKMSNLGTGTTSSDVIASANSPKFSKVVYDKAVFNNATFNSAVFNDVTLNEKGSKSENANYQVGQNGTVYKSTITPTRESRFNKLDEDVKNWNESPSGALNKMYDRGTSDSLIGNWWNNKVNDRREQLRDKYEKFDKLTDGGRLGNPETLTKVSAIADGVKDIAQTLYNFVKPYWQKAKSAFRDNYTKVAGLTSPEQAGTGGFMGINTGTDMFNEMLDSTTSKYGKTAFSYSEEMIPAMTTALEKGFKGQEAIQKAQMDMESSKILPWMDTQSEAWVNMSFNLDKNSLDQIRNQQLIIKQSEEGNRLLQDGIINYLTSDLGPLISNIDSGVASATGYQSLGEYTSLMESYIDQGMSENDAYKAAKEVMNAQQDVYGALTSGNVNQILLGAQFAQGAGVNEAVASSTAQLASGAAASNEAGDLIGGAAQANILGFKGMLAGGWTQNANQLATAGSDSEYQLGGTKELENAVDNISNYNTEDKKYKNWMENTVADATQSIKNFPTEAVSEIAGTVKEILGTLISMAITNAAFGNSTGGMISKLTSGSGVLGKIGTGLGNVGAGIKAGGAGVKAGEITSLGGKIGAGLGRGGITAGGASTATAAVAGVAGLASGGIMGAMDAKSAIDERKKWGVDSKAAAGIGGFFGGGEGGLANAGTNALKWGAIGAGIGSFIPGVGTLIGGGIGALAGGIMGAIGGDNLSKMNQDIGDAVTGTDREKGTFEVGSHAKGLSFVPKDNYKANLHKGEMVANAKTASELRKKGVTGKETDKDKINKKIGGSVDFSNIESILSTISDRVSEVIEKMGEESEELQVAFESVVDTDLSKKKKKK